jgi:hypothetical protein
LAMYLATVDCATAKPSLSNSPWMRGAPQSIFSMLIRRISARRSAVIFGRPPRERDFQRQYRRKPDRCQRTRVSGRIVPRSLAEDGRYAAEVDRLSAELARQREERKDLQSQIDGLVKTDH